MAQIPRSFYGVVDGHNTFMVGPMVFSIPPGNYNVDTFLTTLNGLISGICFQPIIFNRKTGKYTIYTYADSMTFPASSRLQPLFGFPDGTTTVSTDPSGEITSSQVVNLSGLSTVYVTTSLVHSGLGDGYDNTLSTIFVNNSVDFSNVIYQNTQVDRTALPLVSSKDNTLQNFDINIKILDEYGSSVDTNGQDVRLVVLTWRQDDLYPLLKSYIEVRLNEISDNLLKNSTQN